MVKNKVGRSTLPDLKSHCKATVVKTVLYWFKDRKMEQSREYGNRPTYMWTPDFQHKFKGNSGKNLFRNGACKLDSCMQNKFLKPFKAYHVAYINFNSRMDHRPECKT